MCVYMCVCVLAECEITIHTHKIDDNCYIKLQYGD